MITEIINIIAGVTIGTIVGTVVMFKVAGAFTKKILRSVLADEKLNIAVVSFVENSIVAPLNKTNNEDIKKLIVEALEVALGRIKRNE
jgi:hypothetical protein